MAGVSITVYILKMLVFDATEPVRTYIHTLYIVHFAIYHVDCNFNDTVSNNIRLAGSTDAGSGRVEILIGDQWGTICDTFWGLADAEVVCRDLGYSGAQQATAGGCKCT